MSSKWVLLAGGLILALISAWIIIFLIARPISCPDSLPSDYYTCSEITDCLYHPKYQCINNKTLSCVITDDLSAGQSAAKLLMCDCVNNKCITKVAR